MSTPSKEGLEPSPERGVERGAAQRSTASSSGPPAMSGRVRAAIAESIRQEECIRRLDAPVLTKWWEIRRFVSRVRCLVFPGFFEDETLASPGMDGWLERLLAEIHDSCLAVVLGSILYADHVGLPRPKDPAVDESPDQQARRVVDRFLKDLPPLRKLVALDVKAAYEGDPAATHTDEIIACYPGVTAVFSYRVAHLLHTLGVPLAPRIIMEQAHSETGIDIHPAAKIGRSFFIDHGAGVVIGETTVVGDHVKLYQGVTLGARSFERDPQGRLVRGTKRHPTIGDRVTIYAGAVILGGDTIVGDDCVISGGVFLTSSVPARHIVRQKQPELVMRTNRAASSQDGAAI